MAIKNIPLNLIPKGTDRALWKIVDDASIPPGGKSGQVLIKLSDKDYDAVWMDWPYQSGDVDFGSYLVPLEGPYTGIGDPNSTDFGNMGADMTNDLDFGSFANALAGAFGTQVSDPRITTLVTLLGSLVNKEG